MLDEIFNIPVRDSSHYGLSIFSKASSSEEQHEHSMQMVKAPVANAAQSEAITTRR
ncbi:MAG: hypothetical protein JKY56_00795 [Kofleriaceae bacterium]|nr:hypothetical protein [Kofleriaceae bacterium]